MNRLATVALVAAAVAFVGPIGPALAAPSDSTIIVMVDRPESGDQLDAAGSFGGWAVDQSVGNSPGISKIDVYVDGDVTNGRLIGQAKLGIKRPDVVEQFGNPNYMTAGWSFSLAGTGLTGDHNFTFVAFGADGFVSTAAVSPVTLVPSAPPLSYNVSQTFVPVQPTTAAKAEQSLAYASAASFQPVQPTTQTVPVAGAASSIYYQPVTAPTVSVMPQAAMPPYYSTAGVPAYYSTPGAPLGALVPVAPSLPVGTQPAVIASVPVSLALTAPTAGTTAGGALTIAGQTTAVPTNGAVSFQLTDPNGRALASGGLTVTSGAPGQPGAFSGTVAYPTGFAGPARLTVTQTDGGNIVATTTVGLSLIPNAPVQFQPILTFPTR